MKRLFNALVKITGWPVQKILFRTKVYYEDKAVQSRRLKGPAILISNHTSVYDYAVFLFVFWRRTLRYQMAELLFRRRMLKHFLRAMGGIFVDRDAYDFSFVRRSLEILERRIAKTVKLSRNDKAAAKELDLLDKDEFRFVWITEFPQFEWSDEQGRYLAMHHPFTMPMEEDLPLLEQGKLGEVRAKAYDIVLNGNEIGGGSVRIHQNDIQEKMFEALGFTKEQAHTQFGFLLEAFKYGVPPHAGLAYGLDRLVMLMAKQDSIRDVIAFPKIKDASCLMTEAPTPADQKQLDELGLEVKAETEE